MDRSARSASVTAQDQILAHAVVCVGASAVDGGTSRQSMLGLGDGEGRGGEQDGGSRLHCVVGDVEDVSDGDRRRRVSKIKVCLFC